MRGAEDRVDAPHQHPPEAACPPTCPGWAEGALQLFALQRRHAEMLAACQAAEAIESVIVAPGVPGVSLPDYLADEELVRLNLVVGRDTPEVVMDEWGMHCMLTFRGRRTECALPWACILAGTLRPPPRKRPRFEVIEGGKKD
jgi:hypothetical protein